MWYIGQGMEEGATLRSGHAPWSISFCHMAANAATSGQHWCRCCGSDNDMHSSVAEWRTCGSLYTGQLRGKLTLLCFQTFTMNRLSLYHSLCCHADYSYICAVSCRTGGKRAADTGYFVQPTVFADVKDHMKIAREEIFGPVQCIMKWRDTQEVRRTHVAADHACGS